MVHNGIERNPNMMISPGSAGSSSGTGSMIPTPGISQQAHFGIQSLGANSSSVSNPLSQQTSSALQLGCHQIAVSVTTAICFGQRLPIEWNAFTMDPQHRCKAPSISKATCKMNRYGYVKARSATNAPTATNSSLGFNKCSNSSCSYSNCRNKCNHSSSNNCSHSSSNNSNHNKGLMMPGGGFVG
ncbi:hypothetical protein ACLB2K_073792 [Fragaria x ananassa]